jgi:hypothetical protein
MIEKSKNSSPLPGTDSELRPGDFPLGSPKSRAAARAMLTAPPKFILDFGTLAIDAQFLPTYEEFLRDWKDDGDRYTNEEVRAETLFRCAILKNSREMQLIREKATILSPNESDSQCE